MTSYHFFKIIVKENLCQNELELPLRFVRLYGESLPNRVFLRPPSGPSWRLRVVKRTGKVWLARGWQEFAKYFSMKPRHLIFFRYKGNAEFKVSICDTSTCQIRYPHKPIANANLRASDSSETETETDVLGQISEETLSSSDGSDQFSESEEPIDNADDEPGFKDPIKVRPKYPMYGSTRKEVGKSFFKKKTRYRCVST